MVILKQWLFSPIGDYQLRSLATQCYLHRP